MLTTQKCTVAEPVRISAKQHRKFRIMSYLEFTVSLLHHKKSQPGALPVA